MRVICCRSSRFIGWDNIVAMVEDMFYCSSLNRMCFDLFYNVMLVNL